MSYKRHKLFIALFMLFSPVTIAAQPVEISLDPMSQVVEKGLDISINVSIDPAGNSITTAQFNMYFNGTLVKIKNVTEGNLLKQNGANTVFNSGNINNSEETLINVWGLVITPGNNVTTKDTLAVIIMEAKDTGSSGLDLTNVIVSDPASQAVQTLIYNGHVNSTVSLVTQTSSSGNIGGDGGGGGGQEAPQAKITPTSS